MPSPGRCERFPHRLLGRCPCGHAIWQASVEQLVASCVTIASVPLRSNYMPSLEITLVFGSLSEGLCWRCSSP